MRAIFFVLALSLAATGAQAEEFVGRFFAIGKTSDTPIYQQYVTSEDGPDGTTLLTSVLTDPEGHVLIKEHAVILGINFISQEILNFQEKKSYRAEVKDNKVTFQTSSMPDVGEGKLLSSHTETIKGKFVTGPLAEPFIKANWEDLESGKRIDARFAVFEREETIGFSYKKKVDVEIDGKPAMVILMKPTSFFVSLVVAPIEITIDKEFKHIVHYKGRTPVKMPKDKTLDAEIAFDRNTPVIVRDTASTKKNKHTNERQ